MLSFNVDWISAREISSRRAGVSALSSSAVAVDIYDSRPGRTVMRALIDSVFLYFGSSFVCASRILLLLYRLCIVYQYRVGDVMGEC